MTSRLSHGWTPERRKKQAEKIRRWKPWDQSTGPRTKEGKNKACKNSLKHGLRSVTGKEFFRLLTQQKLFVRMVQIKLKSQNCYPACPPKPVGRRRKRSAAKSKDLL